MSGECRWWRDLDTTGALCTHLRYCRAFSASRKPLSLRLGTFVSCSFFVFFRRRFTSNNCNWIVERTSVLQHIHAALPSKQRSIQPFVGRWAEPSEFPSPANCPWISFGISKRHQWPSKAFLYHRDTKIRLCRDESILIITPLNLTSLLFTHWHAKFFSHVSRASLKSAPKVPEDVVWCGRPAMMMRVSSNERNWPLTSHYYFIT